jgi:pimeloyl-ACP methyl ester carboxylesterase
MRRKVAAVCLIVSALIAALPFAMDGERVTLDAELRERLTSEGHRFAAIELGTIHYELAGPDSGQLVVLVHGVSGPMEAFDAVVEPLHEAGFRTLRYDHFGRGWSERLDVPHDLELFVTSLEQLLAALELEAEPLRLVGSSMGAIVCSELALRHPNRVERVALLGPAGFPIEASFLAKLIDVPGIGDYLMKTFGDRSLAEHNRSYFVHPQRFTDFQARYEEQLEVEGTKHAILSTMRHAPVQGYVDGYRRLGASEKRVLIVWGRQDTVFPYHHHETAEEAIVHADLLAVDDAGHLPMLEQPAAVLARLIPFLQGEG